MRKVIAGINMTLDGYCDHTAVTADDELHDYFTEMLRSGGTLLYGRKTFELMEYWRPFVEKPTGEKAMDDFARVIDQIPKLVFSRTLTAVDWPTTSLARRSPEEEVLELRQQSGKDILVGSPSLIVALTEARLIDEYRICIHPVIAGDGLPLFRDISNKVELKLLRSAPFGSGAILVCYETVR